MPPEVYGAVSLACKATGAVAALACRRLDGRGQLRLRRKREKIQKHIARALAYQRGRLSEDT
jgi:ribosomal protein L40E